MMSLSGGVSELRLRAGVTCCPGSSSAGGIVFHVVCEMHVFGLLTVLATFGVEGRLIQTDGSAQGQGSEARMPEGPGVRTCPGSQQRQRHESSKGA